MKEQSAQIAAAYWFHGITFGMCAALPPDPLAAAVLVAGAVFLISRIAANRKSYMPWRVYGHFLLGLGVKLLLIWFCGVLSALAGALYFTAAIAFAGLLGLVNLAMWLLHRLRKKYG